MSISQAARMLAGKGFQIFPLRPNSKLPLIANWPELASNHPQWIDRWWPEHPVPNETGGFDPEPNIGVATGHGLVVIDIDVKNGKAGLESLKMLEALHGDMPNTFTVRTPSGGFHYYLAVDPDIRFANAVDLFGLPGVDVRGEGGYVVGPGSVLDTLAYVPV